MQTHSMILSVCVGSKAPVESTPPVGQSSEDGKNCWHAPVTPEKPNPSAFFPLGGFSLPPPPAAPPRQRARGSGDRPVWAARRYRRPALRTARRQEGTHLRG